MIAEYFSDAVNFLSKGGIVMIFILLCSIAAVVLFIERWLAIRGAVRRSGALAPELLDSIEKKQYERAFMRCDAYPGPLSDMARTALGHKDLTREALQEMLSDEGHRQEVRLNKRVPALGAISTISPLLGLLGTVTGMITIFSRLADEYAAGATANPGMLAGGIWEALLTTAAGLCVAIPTFILHRILCGKIDNFMLDLEKNTSKIVDCLAPAPKQGDSGFVSASDSNKPASGSGKKNNDNFVIESGNGKNGDNIVTKSESYSRAGKDGGMSPEGVKTPDSPAGTGKLCEEKTAETGGENSGEASGTEKVLTEEKKKK